MKKILFIESRTGGDFAMDAVWAGLVDKFGAENVIDWPSKDKHREGIPQITGDVEKDYGAERRSICYTSSYKDRPKLISHDINTMLRTGMIETIFVDERQETYDIYVKTIAPYMDVPVIAIAGHDKYWNMSPDRPMWMLKQYYGSRLKAAFVDNWRPSYEGFTGLYPMSYATNFDHLWEYQRREEFLSDKVYDICFMGYNSHGERGVIVDHLLQKYGTDGNCLFVEKRPNTMEAFLPKREYFKKMAQSKICINLKGGAECGKALRFYEIPYVGSYMLSQKFGGKQVHPFEAGIHCDYFDSIDLLDKLIESRLHSEERREQIAKAGHEHAMKFHTARARVDYIYECINGQR